MSTSSIRDKTIRPGSLNGYNYYHSNRAPAKDEKPKTNAKSKSTKKYVFLAILIIVVGFWLGFKDSANSDTNKASIASQSKSPNEKSGAPAVAVNDEKPKTTINRCEGNTLEKHIEISVNGRHLWACEGSKLVHDSAVITGLKDHSETETPLGTYKIYAKTTNTSLSGSDSRGSWNYPVYYWMPFLDNQYGTYGFHDATWRKASEFGNISPTSQEASHGCIELPLASQKWLYNWAPVGTTVTVES